MSNTGVVKTALIKEKLIRSGFYDLAVVYQSLHVNPLFACGFTVFTFSLQINFLNDHQLPGIFVDRHGAAFGGHGAFVQMGGRHILLQHGEPLRGQEAFRVRRFGEQRNCAVCPDGGEQRRGPPTEAQNARIGNAAAGTCVRQLLRGDGEQDVAEGAADPAVGQILRFETAAQVVPVGELHTAFLDFVGKLSGHVCIARIALRHVLQQAQAEFFGEVRGEEQTALRQDLLPEAVLRGGHVGKKLRDAAGSCADAEPSAAFAGAGLPSSGTVGLPVVSADARMPEPCTGVSRSKSSADASRRRSARAEGKRCVRSVGTEASGSGSAVSP